MGCVTVFGSGGVRSSEPVGTLQRPARPVLAGGKELPTKQPSLFCRGRGVPSAVLGLTDGRTTLRVVVEWQQPDALRIRESDGEALSRFRPLEKSNGTITSWLAYCPAPFGELELKERGVTDLPD